VTTLYPHEPDPRFSGAINRSYTTEVYAEERARLPPFSSAVRPWHTFPTPRPSITRHGIWIADALHAEHAVTRGIRGWREWTAGVPEHLLRDGHVAIQRSIGRWPKARGTRTYYHNGTALVSPLHVATFENALVLTPTGAVTQSVTVGTAGVLGWVATGPSGEPNAAAWPAGTYRHQLDVTATGVDLAYGLLTLGAGTGHFARVNAALGLEIETHAQSEAAFGGAGLRLATYAAGWVAGLVSDRLEVAIAVQRITGHGTQSLFLQVGEADDYVDGPWAAAPAGPAAVLHGCNT